ncbi:MAG: hypothetical protein IPH20_14465 [Bacteroidales bacterium]|nr:hypothetical protein [Bacteroidales bacterium]
MLRRALLTRGDYSMEDGYSTNIGGNRYSFAYGDSSWKDFFNDNNSTQIIKELLICFHGKTLSFIQLPPNEILDQIINDFLETKLEKDWIYYFVKNPKILAYCNQKYACFVTEEISEIYLLQGKKNRRQFQRIETLCLIFILINPESINQLMSF